MYCKTAETIFQKYINNLTVYRQIFLWTPISAEKTTIDANTTYHKEIKQDGRMPHLFDVTWISEERFLLYICV